MRYTKAMDPPEEFLKSNIIPKALEPQISARGAREGSHNRVTETARVPRQRIGESIRNHSSGRRRRMQSIRGTFLAFDIY